MFKTAFFALLAATCCPAQYALQSNFSGAAFFDNFDFYDSWDPTLGFVHYVDRTTAQAFGLINASESGPATFGVEHTQILDPEANLGRASLRLISHQTWTHGLFILDLAHMPASQCGTWPAFWTVGGPSEWPQNGEIDIIEYTNTKTNNSMALHTRENCTIAGSGQTGKLLTNDCGKDLGVAGCYVAPNKSDSAGSSFNSIGGGVYAMEWTSVAIRIWFFPRLAIPANVRSPNPDPALWGLPDANFESSDCDIDSYFFNHSILFDTEFCYSHLVCVHKWHLGRPNIRRGCMIDYCVWHTSSAVDFFGHDCHVLHNLIDFSSDHDESFGHPATGEYELYLLYELVDAILVVVDYDVFHEPAYHSLAQHFCNRRSHNYRDYYGGSCLGHYYRYAGGYTCQRGLGYANVGIGL
ncbi:glycoside hydrolase family 16 [Lecanosticta acicola]|uniref:Glycoside hydrolase family 16, partial n=1 Tax=Lecanosticta acicola TaxID=111012 RepID=A0AAI8Z7T3_9PEZI|nr:glycoside hydrolase family 16 [Lecanosticta acicola]